MVDCGLHLTHRTEDLAGPGTQKKKKNETLKVHCKHLAHQETTLWQSQDKKKYYAMYLPSSASLKQ